MQQVDQGDEGITGADQPEIAILQVIPRVPGEDEQREGDGNGGDLDQAVKQQIAVQTAEIKPKEPAVTRPARE